MSEQDGGNGASKGFATIIEILGEMSKDIRHAHHRIDETNRQLADTNRQLADTNRQLADTNRRLDDTNRHLGLLAEIVQAGFDRVAGQIAEINERIDASNRRAEETLEFLKVQNKAFQSLFRDADRLSENHEERITKLETQIRELTPRSRGPKRAARSPRRKE
ncbi:MAG: hypothetical protein HY791_27395 [Deltaproteobacteria bacterium]|nr:hypothetical protein [Deltaproteobacteria bacterium]